MTESAGENTLLHAIAAGQGEMVQLPRTLVLFAHPDDEVIALGGRLGRFSRAFFAHATDGAPAYGADAAAQSFRTLAAYRAARQEELRCALGFVGILPSQLRELGFADQTLAYSLPALVRSTLALLQQLRPEVVITHPYEGGHPDHDACAFAARTALQLLRENGDAEGSDSPVLVEAAFYHACPDGIETGSFLPGGEAGVSRPHSFEEQEQKQRLFRCFHTQRGTLQYFSTGEERFRLAPQYDFSRPPHEGKLFYENYSWGVDGSTWRALAEAAARELGEGRAPA